MSATIAKPNKEKPSTVTPAEAAWLTELSPKTINATIDRGELGRSPRPRSAGARARRLGPADVVYLVLRKELSDVLSAAAKRELYERLVEVLSRRGLALQSTDGRGADFEIELAGGVIRVEMKGALRRLSKRWQALERAADVVVSDPGIRGGEPVIRGTRIPVYLIADLLSQGADAREILEDYPSLSANTVRSALAYAQTHPRRGRPRKAPWRV
jgi:uncharacterized protein (DUF433 family)